MNIFKKLKQKKRDRAIDQKKNSSNKSARPKKIANIHLQ